MKTAQEFNETKATKIVATDSDGTMTPFVPLARMQEAKPTPEYLEAMRQASFEDPETLRVILTGRKNGEGNNIYGDALKPDDEGRIPKIIIATENGAFLQTKPIDSEELMIPAGTDGMVQAAEPLTDEFKAEVQEFFNSTAGNHYTEDPGDQSEEKWFRAEVKTYGYTIHYREPADEAQKQEFDQMKEQIKGKLTEIGQNTDMEVHLGATSSFTMEKVSKGATLTKLIEGDAATVQTLADAGIQMGTVTTAGFFGDDRGDQAAQEVVNSKVAAGEIQGGTYRTSNFTPFDPDHRVPNAPKETVVQDSMYMIGSSETLPQEIHRSNFLQPDLLENIDALRQDLSDKGLLPSKNDENTPPLVLLTSGDILIQEPERYPQETLDTLKDWDKGKVVLMVNEGVEASQSLKLKEMARDNANIVAVTPQGNVFQQGESLDLSGPLTAAKAANQIPSTSEERSAEIQLLRAIQATLVGQGIITPKPILEVAKQPQPQQQAQQQEAQDGQQAMQVEPVAPVAAAAQAAGAEQQAAPAAAQAPVAGVAALAQLPAQGNTIGERVSNRRRSRSQEQTSTSSRRRRMQ